MLFLSSKKQRALLERLIGPQMTPMIAIGGHGIGTGFFSRQRHLSTSGVIQFSFRKSWMAGSIFGDQLDQLKNYSMRSSQRSKAK